MFMMVFMFESFLYLFYGENFLLLEEFVTSFNAFEKVIHEKDSLFISVQIYCSYGIWETFIITENARIGVLKIRMKRSHYKNICQKFFLKRANSQCLIVHLCSCSEYKNSKDLSSLHASLFRNPRKLSFRKLDEKQLSIHW